MGKWAGTALFYVAQADVTVLLEAWIRTSPRLYAQLFQQLTAAADMLRPTLPYVPYRTRHGALLAAIVAVGLAAATLLVQARR
jgi:hypothetical protein